MVHFTQRDQVGVPCQELRADADDSFAVSATEWRVRRE